MRFLQISMLGPARIGAPDPDHMKKIQQMIGEGISTGAILATGPIGKRATAAARVIKKDGKFTVEDPPQDGSDGGGWLAGGGYSLTAFDTKEAAIERAKATLDTMGEGMIELIQVGEMYPLPKVPGPPMAGVIPYCSVDGANEAGELYKKAFGAIEHRRMLHPDGKRLMHLHLEINGGALMLSDCFPEHGMGHQPSHSFTMTLVVTEGKRWWDRAVGAGLEVKMPFEKQMWGDNYGSLVDQFGVNWAINELAKA